MKKLKQPKTTYQVALVGPSTTIAQVRSFAENGSKQGWQPLRIHTDSYLSAQNYGPLIDWLNGTADTKSGEISFYTFTGTLPALTAFKMNLSQTQWTMTPFLCPDIETAARIACALAWTKQTPSYFAACHNALRGPLFDAPQFAQLGLDPALPKGMPHELIDPATTAVVNERMAEVGGLIMAAAQPVLGQYRDACERWLRAHVRRAFGHTEFKEAA